MRRRLIAAALGLACCAAGASAQSLQPQFYMWDRPPTNDPWTDPQMLPLLLSNAGLPTTDPVEIAEAFALEIQEYFDAGRPMNKIAILIFNFGAAGPSSGFSLIDDEDAIDPEPAWEDPQQGPSNPLMPFQQPWMGSGREELKAWMEDFLTAYSAETYNNGTANVPLPTPARFHFDCEISLSDNWHINHTRVLRALPSDSRWTNVPVPGFGLATMAELYEDAVEFYGWPDVELTHASALDPGEIPDHDDNRHYFLWYWSICERALSASLDEVATEVIREHFDYDPAVRVVSNWGDTDTNGQTATFGWYSTPNYANLPSWPLGVLPAREWINGKLGEGSDGPRYLRVDPENSGYVQMWGTIPGTRTGDLSAPHLYTHLGDLATIEPGQNPVYAYTHKGFNYYLPGWNSSPSASSSWESTWDSSLRNHRHWIESILNSGSTPDQITPWIPHTGTNTHKQLVYIVQPEDTRRQLAMLRAKNIGEILVWGNDADPGITLASWLDFSRYIKQVYSPVLQSYSLVEGTASLPGPAALQYTLVDPGNDHVVVLSSTNAIASIDVLFEGLWPNTSLPKLGDHLRLNLELTAFIEDMTSDDRAEMRVKVYMYKDSIQDWVAVPCSDPSPLSNNEVGFYAPIADDTCEMRRTLTIDHCIVENDDLQVRVVVYNVEGTPFRADFNLVQLFWTEIEAIVCEGDTDLLGADSNYSGEVTTQDLTKFTADYLYARPAADFDNNGTVNASDMAAFLARYGQ